MTENEKLIKRVENYRDGHCVVQLDALLADGGNPLVYKGRIDSCNQIIAALRRTAEDDKAREEGRKTAYDENGTPYLIEAEGSEAKHIIELLAAEAQGRLVVLPLVAMVEQSLQGGDMKPERDQRFNGRYAVVYSGKGKWGCPLIDICGTPYNSDQAEERKNEITRQEVEAALGGGEGG